jgi:hypothetical protein
MMLAPTQETARAVLLAMRELRADGPDQSSAGICYNTTNRTRSVSYDDASDCLGWLFAELGRDTRYPVPHPTLSAEDAYQEVQNVWIGEYGENRRALLNECIGFLTFYIRTTDALADTA